MKRKELLDKASTQTGVQIRPHILQHAQRTGKIPTVEIRGGWASYGDEHLAALVGYVQHDSHIGLEPIQ